MALPQDTRDDVSEEEERARESLKISEPDKTRDDDKILLPDLSHAVSGSSSSSSSSESPTTCVRGPLHQQEQEYYYSNFWSNACIMVNSSCGGDGDLCVCGSGVTDEADDQNSPTVITPKKSLPSAPSSPRGDSSRETVQQIHQQDFGFSAELSEAFSNGTLASFCWNQIMAGLSHEKQKDKDTKQQQHEYIWKGHLPLGPAYPERRRKKKAPVNNNFVDICLPPDDFIPTHNISSSADTTTTLDLPRIFSGEDLVAAESTAAAQSNEAPVSLSPPPPAAPAGPPAPRMRGPPPAQASMTIPAAQQAAVRQQIQQHMQHPPRMPSNPTIVQVHTPGADRSALKELPALRDAPAAKREELFVAKLQLCSVIFSFDDPTADKRGKDMKRQTLLELVDYVNTPAGQKIFTEGVMADLMACVSANVCRALPPATDDFDPEEDEPVLEPAWPHLQVAYEFFLRFIVSSEVNAKAAKKYVDQKFCLQLVELFDSEDPRERDYLKTILHRIYGKFMSHRSFIRRAISNVFYRFVYETERHNGIGELLEILGSIINGFAIPLKKEHLQFLVRALIPLHKPKCVALYHQQLSYCIIQYVEKDADTATPILNGFFKCWPWSCSSKQVMFLNELEEILELLGADQLSQVSNMLFTNLARCLDSEHFQVVERALFLWNNEHLVNSGCLSRLNAQQVLPIIYGPLYKNSSGHWNATVEGLAQNVLKMYMEYDLVLYDKCTAAYLREEEEAKRKLAALSDRWSAIEELALANQRAVSA